MDWIIPANPRKYNHINSILSNGLIDWSQKNNFEVGDTIYVYLGKPVSRISILCVVTDINILYSKKTDDKDYWYDLKEYETSKSIKYCRLTLKKILHYDGLSY